MERKTVKFSESKTLTELEKDDWGDSKSDSYIEQNCYSLRKKKIREFDVEDLRIMINQDIGLPYLLPKALQMLEEDPLAEGMHYKGDLLCSVLRVNSEFYKSNNDYKVQVEALVKNAIRNMKSLDEIDLEVTKEALDEAVEYFKR